MKTFTNEDSARVYMASHSTAVNRNNFLVMVDGPDDGAGEVSVMPLSEAIESDFASYRW